MDAFHSVDDSMWWWLLLLAVVHVGAKRPSATQEPVIEEVTAKQLERILEEKDYVAVFWCKYPCICACYADGLCWSDLSGFAERDQVISGVTWPRFATVSECRVSIRDRESGDGMMSRFGAPPCPIRYALTLGNAFGPEGYGSTTIHETIIQTRAIHILVQSVINP